MKKDGKKFWFALFQIWLLIWTTLFLMPTKYLAGESGMFDAIPHFDKIVHMGIFFIFSLFICKYNNNFLRSAIITFIFTAFYGILIETLQRIVGRGFDIYDYLADFIGVGIFYNLIFLSKIYKDYIKPKFNKKK